eukprot:5295319-Pyramimonas_sp.AAC.2
MLESLENIAGMAARLSAVSAPDRYPSHSPLTCASAPHNRRIRHLVEDQAQPSDTSGQAVQIHPRAPVRFDRRVRSRSRRRCTTKIRGRGELAASWR